MKKNCIYIDEAGRGPLAGPLYVGAIFLVKKLPVQTEFLIADSKMMSEAQRESSYEYLQTLVKKQVLVYGVGIVSHDEIDARGMTKALNQAIQRAVKEIENQILDLPKCTLVIDGNRSFNLEKDGFEVETIIKGDQKVKAISMASIIAKVSRDREMLDQHKTYPLYGFDQHKGYGTKKHRDAIAKHGACPIHRKLFLRKLLKS